MIDFNNEHYAFVSYSHDDKDIVIPIVKKMQERWVRLWFDEKIRTGSKWDESIRFAIEDCKVFLLFVSSYYFSSEYCLKEFNIARENAEKNNMEFMIIYLEDTTVPDEIEQYISPIQSIMLYKIFLNKTFYQKLLNAEIIQDCYYNRFEIMEMCKIDCKNILYFQVEDAESESEARKILLDNYRYYYPYLANDDEEEMAGNAKKIEEMNEEILEIKKDKNGKIERFLCLLASLFIFFRFFVLLSYPKIDFISERVSQDYIIENWKGILISYVLCYSMIGILVLKKKKYFYMSLRNPIMVLSIVNLLAGIIWFDHCSIVCLYNAMNFMGMAEIGMTFCHKELKKIGAKNRFNFESKTEEIVMSNRLLKILIYFNLFSAVILYLLLLLEIL